MIQRDGMASRRLGHADWNSSVANLHNWSFGHLTAMESQKKQINEIP